MPQIQQFRLPSAREGHTIYAQAWLPDGPPRAAVQIVHGIAEHVGRYEEIAQFLAAHGFLVCGEDHLGHGRTVEDGAYGFLPRKAAGIWLWRTCAACGSTWARNTPASPASCWATPWAPFWPAPT